MLKKVYLEITNVCNLNCTFCHGTKREKKFMTPANFHKAAQKIRPFTQYLYLHVLGEPLLHPQLKEILDICEEYDFKVTVTTNGTLLAGQTQTLLNSKALYKVCVSLHSFESNEAKIPLEDYIASVCDFCAKASQQGILCVLRLWNDGGDENKLNTRIRAKLAERFPGEYKENRNGITLAHNIFLEFGDRFVWPDKNESEQNARFCMGLRDQLAVLCDGTIVPCCLDAEGEMALGNLFETDISAALSSPLATSIVNGFSNGKATQALCRHCDFAKRKFG